MIYPDYLAKIRYPCYFFKCTCTTLPCNKISNWSKLCSRRFVRCKPCWSPSLFHNDIGILTPSKYYISGLHMHIDESQVFKTRFELIRLTKYPTHRSISAKKTTTRNQYCSWCTCRHDGTPQEYHLLTQMCEELIQHEQIWHHLPLELRPTIYPKVFQ